ncbi:MAG: hypothetical protein QOI11_1831 [Candidatus Eremiobacteraeota bacterium]|nr:hypothetical protein [Candidatus Eremiobacteraeota bacterium]
MTVTASNPVLRWVGDAQYAEQQTGVPANVLLGLVEIESGGHEGLTSTAHAGGLTQFIPATAAQYDVDVTPGHSRSQILGAAKYLKALGFSSDPALALSKYNAGPLNPSAAGPYAANVLAAARKYTGAKGTAAPTSSAGAATASGTGTATDVVTDTGSVAAKLTRVLVFLVMILGGAALVALGVGRATGIRHPVPA